MGITLPDWRQGSFGSATKAYCITMRRRTGPRLKFGTSLERIAPESLTREVYDFVHGDIWRAVAAKLPDRVARR